MIYVKLRSHDNFIEEKMKLPFYSKPGFYDKHRCRVSNSCEKCGKEFAEGEKTWRRFLSNGNRKLGIKGYFKTVGYWCDECHEALYFVTRRKTKGIGSHDRKREPK
jgi:hypothetical protein